MRTLVPTYDAMECPHPLRTHQREALDAVDTARAAGSTRWWVTMPPGAGKTLVGTEVARSLGHRVVVLSPNTAIQGQWSRTWNAYAGPAAGTRRDLGAAFTSLTYQSLAVFDADEEDDPGSQVGRLHPNGVALIEAMKAAGPLTVVLDECHHLLEVWGELLREVLDQLPEASVLGLTATPPAAMTRGQSDLTRTLFGPVLYEARIPALVKAGTLAPYAELAWLGTPTAEEAAWLGEQATRFAELTADLFDPTFGSTPLPVWLTQRFVAPTYDGAASWPELVAREPELTDAALRLVHADLLELPVGAIVHEQHRQPPAAEDWRVLLDDWLLHCIQPRSESDDPSAAGDLQVLDVVRRTLPAIGYVWTKRGVRTGRGVVDRVTARSTAKETAATAIVSAEHANLGGDARVLVLCDHERATATTRRRVADGEDPPPQPAGSALGVLARLLDDPVAAALDPVLVTGRTVAAAEPTLRALVAWIDQTHPGLAASLVVGHEDDVPTLSGRWTTGQWVTHVTGFFTAGGTRALIGTRGLLGEGWDAPAVTTLVDLTTATTPTAVVQTRGRALRTDPERPDKVALVWSVVCVHEGHATGANDWDRFARKHRGYFTVDETGSVVDGLAGVDSGFSDYHPPPATEFDEVNARMLVRAEDRDGIREEWLDDGTYRDQVQHVVRLRSAERPAVAEPATSPDSSGLVPWTDAVQRRPEAWRAAVPTGLSLTLVLGVLLGLSRGWLLLAVPLFVLGLAQWGRSSLLAASRHRPTLGLVAAAVADGLQGAGLSPVGAAGLHVETSPDGEVSFTLTGGGEEVSARFATALEEVVSPMSGPRYVVPRWVTDPPSGLSGLTRGLRALRGHRPDGEVWHTVPAVLADRREHADAFAHAWGHWIGGGPAVYAGSPEGAGVVAAQRGVDPFDVTCVIRRVWH